MNKLSPSKVIYLVPSEYLCVVKIAGRTGNLVLTTCVKVETDSNNTTVAYKVQSWNEKHTRLSKQFTNYTEAHEYYRKIYNKFGTK